MIMRLLFCLTAVCFGQTTCVAQQNATSQSKTVSKAAEIPVPAEQDVTALEQLTQAFVNAYNDHDATKLASLFADDAELGERSGEKNIGRDEIHSAFEGGFAVNPKTKISVDVHGVHFVTGTVAVAEGIATSYPDGETAAAEIGYRIGYAKRAAGWQIVSMRAYDSQILSNYEYLRRLDWMVGEWVDQNRGSVVHATVRWAPNRAFLIREFSVRSGGQKVLEGTQRIGWDSQKKQVRSWLFDSEGGFVEGHWTIVDGGWIVRSTGYLMDGSSVSGTTRIDRKSNDSFVMSFFNRLRGSETLPDVDVTIVRKPPEPGVGKPQAASRSNL